MDRRGERCASLPQMCEEGWGVQGAGDRVGLQVSPAIQQGPGNGQLPVCVCVCVWLGPHSMPDSLLGAFIASLHIIPATALRL